MTLIQNYQTLAKYFLCQGLFLFLFISCQKDEIGEMLPNRTVIVYMIADNNLDAFSITDINEMEKGWNNATDGNLIVYVDRAEGAVPSHPIVYKIENDTSETIVSKIIKVYPEQDSTDPYVMNEVLLNIINEYPAQSYGLILWSHGSAWFPKGTELNVSKSEIRKRILPLTKSFGKDGDNEMDIIDLKKSLPLKFQFLIFDACYMGSIEVLYELKDKAEYIISSPTEVLSSGFPYTSIVPLLFKQVINYENVADTYYQSYNKLDGIMKTASISVIKTSDLYGLAQSVNQIMSDSSNLLSVNLDSIQQFTIYNNRNIFDLKDFVYSVCNDSTLLNNFNKSLNNTIIFKASTPSIFDELRITSFSGLSVFIPNFNKNNYYEFYKKYQWYQDCNYSNYFIKFHFNDE